MFFFSSLSGAEQGSSPSFEPQPAWVQQADSFPPPKRASTNEAAEGIYFVLVDDQVNVGSEQKFHRVIKDFVNENGVQNEARLTLNFDPSYQRLIIHEIKLHRGTNSLDRLQPGKIKIIQQERQLERHIYNGTVSAVVFLEDVRVGDRADYSYTIQGFNPILAGRHADSFSTQYGTPIGRKRFRLLWPAKRSLKFQSHGPAQQPEIHQNGETTEYVWIRATSLPF